MDSLIINGISFDIKITYRQSTRLKLKIITSSQLEVVCHKLTPKFMIKKFINDNQNWITLNHKKVIQKTNFLELKSLNILDKTYKVLINKTSRDSVIINEIEQIIYINTSLLDSDNIKLILEKRLRRLARILINKYLEELKLKHDFFYKKISIKNQSSRFGSCSSLGNLNFNWQIILFPYDKFIHILLHELNHLKIKNHQAEFWYQLAVYDNNCFANNKFLKTEGKKLLIFS